MLSWDLSLKKLEFQPKRINILAIRTCYLRASEAGDVDKPFPQSDYTVVYSPTLATQFASEVTTNIRLFTKTNIIKSL